jgi:hypothetical protein
VASRLNFIGADQDLHDISDLPVAQFWILTVSLNDSGLDILQHIQVAIFE